MSFGHGVSPPCRVEPVLILMIVKRRNHLFFLILALHVPCRLAGRLHGWQQERNQDPDNGDDNEKFNQREAPAAPRTISALEQSHSHTLHM